MALSAGRNGGKSGQLKIPNQASFSGVGETL
jgi:hypothetical protein